VSLELTQLHLNLNLTRRPSHLGLKDQLILRILLSFYFNIYFKYLPLIFPFNILRIYLLLLKIQY